jgi:hypothetical protein
MGVVLQVYAGENWEGKAQDQGATMAQYGIYLAIAVGRVVGSIVDDRPRQVQR